MGLLIKCSNMSCPGLVLLGQREVKRDFLRLPGACQAAMLSGHLKGMVAKPSDKASFPTGPVLDHKRHKRSGAEYDLIPSICFLRKVSNLRGKDPCYVLP